MKMKMTVLFAAVSLAVSIYIGVDFDKLGKKSTENRNPEISTDPFGDYKSLFYASISESSPALHHDFYQDSCPTAEEIIAKSIRDIYAARPRIAPSLIRLLFHDCFIEGCDASVLLDADETQSSEKEAIPNLTLKGFDVIDAIKSKLEIACPGVVSCSDILVLAARESVLVAGGPMYHLKTGRRDGTLAFKEAAQLELPSPHANISQVVRSFASRGFSERETVCLLGAHSIGITHCTFFEDRLYNFSGTGKPDPTLNPGILQELKTKCPALPSSLSPSPFNNYGAIPKNRPDRVVDLSFDNEGGDEDFGTRFYRRLLQKKGVMFADQQLTSRNKTKAWVRTYASDQKLFRRDFAKSMVKLSLITGNLGQIRTTHFSDLLSTVILVKKYLTISHVDC